MMIKTYFFWGTLGVYCFAQAIAGPASIPQGAATAVVLSPNGNESNQQLKLRLLAKEIQLEQQILQIKQQLLQLQQQETTEQTYKSHNNISWLDSSNGQIPHGALTVGKAEGKPLYVCHAQHLEGVHPGQLTDKGCVITYAGKVLTIAKYQVLTGKQTVQWKPAERLIRFLQQSPYSSGIVFGYENKGTDDGFAPSFPVVGGYEPERSLYICRAMHGDSIHLGKVVADKCNIASQDREQEVTTFEVLFN